MSRLLFINCILAYKNGSDAIRSIQHGIKAWCWWRNGRKQSDEHDGLQQSASDAVAYGDVGNDGNAGVANEAAGNGKGATADASGRNAATSYGRHCATDDVAGSRRRRETPTLEDQAGGEGARVLLEYVQSGSGRRE